MTTDKRIAIFASGNGTNAENLIRYFNDGRHGAEVVLVVCNRQDAPVIEKAERLGVEACFMTRAGINDPDKMLVLLGRRSVDIIVLAGFLLMVPPFLIEHYRDRIVNIHPSLLPKYGGKGMYGANVHKAVVEAGEKETGITIHFVSENYDEGRIIFQARTTVEPADTPSDVERKIHQLEHEHYARVVHDALIVDGHVQQSIPVSR